MNLVRAVIAACLLLVPVLGKSQDSNPISVNAILAAQPFKLAQPYGALAAGTLLVLDVDAPLLTPGESANAILYIAGRPTQPLNHGDVSGHVLVIVASDVDIAGSLMWFGAPDLPEALTAEQIQAEIDIAKKILAGPPGKPLSTRKAVESRDFAALLRDAAAPLIDEFSPQDGVVAEMWRLKEGG
jgi:hypothetical protein